MNITTSTAGGYWEMVPFTVQGFADRDVWTVVYEGFWESLFAAFQYSVGDEFAIDEEANPGGDYQPYVFISSIHFQRKVGGLGECKIQYTSLLKREIWNLDFAEVSKDIKNWLVQKYTTWANGGSTVDGEVYEELAKIQSWEELRRQNNLVPWGQFKFWDKDIEDYDNLEGDTLTLAQKMMKGITNYPVYTPVITRTTVWAFSPPAGDVGFKDTPEPRSGWDGFNGENPITSGWTKLASVFLKTAEKSNSNGDGSYTLVEQWTGADELDPDLYPSVSEV